MVGSQSEDNGYPFPFPLPLSPAMPQSEQFSMSTLYPGMNTQPTGGPSYSFGNSPYQKGGSINLNHLANKVRRHGEDEDEILAYINPEEAQELHMRFGSDVNPHTGLPQFGFFKKLKKAVAPVRKILPIVGAIGGNAIAPGIGGVIGGGALGALAGKKSLKGGITGAALGALQGYGFPALGKLLGSQGMPHLAQGFTDLGASKLGGFSSIAQGLGMSPGMGGGVSNSSYPKFEKAMQGGDGSQEITSPGGTSWLDYILLGLTGAGVLGAKTKHKVPKHERNQPSFKELVSQLRESYAHDAHKEYYQPKPFGMPAWMNEVPRVTEEEYEYPEFGNGYTHHSYKEGGRIEGESGGQDDDVDMPLPVGGYVIDATTVSSLGDGNTERGFKVLEDMRERALSKYPHLATGGNVSHEMIPAKVSTGEFFYYPHEVTAIGDGKNQDGAKKLKKMVGSVRKYKGLKKGLPPKIKSINSHIKI